MSARLLVVTSCTGVKVDCAPGERVAAEDLYAGEQHRRLMRGVVAYRSSPAVAEAGGSLDLWVLSAGHGLVPAAEKLAPYDKSFAGMRSADLIAHAESLDVPSKLQSLLATPFKAAVLLLGDNYLKAAGLDASTTLAGPTFAFCGKAAALRLAGISGLWTVVLDRRAAQGFSCGLVGLKGEVARRLLVRLAKAPEAIAHLASADVDVLEWLEDEQAQLELHAAA